MKNTFLCLSCFVFISVSLLNGIEKPGKGLKNQQEFNLEQDTVSELIDYLKILKENSDNSFFKLHWQSIINIINSRTNLIATEISFLSELYTALTDSNMIYNSGRLSSYLERQRPFIISWISPTDGATSLAWLIPPENWDTDKSYPLYIRLHGLYDPYTNPIEYMTMYLKSETLIQATFDNGYSLYPWGRGNLWYEGISETDIWECISCFESISNVDQKRKYLVGHSMGGYGAWAIGQKSPDVWAGLGIYAGALWYNNYKYLNASAVQSIKDVPVYIVCGDQDGLLGDNQTAYNLLQNAGDDNIFFTTFSGGHVSLLENWQNMYDWLKQWTNNNSTYIKKNNEPLNFELHNYPNPFNPSTFISYFLPEDCKVTLKVYDILGNEVSTLVNEAETAGSYEVTFNTNNNMNNQQLSSGIYFYKLETGKYSATKKMMLVR